MIFFAFPTAPIVSLSTPAKRPSKPSVKRVNKGFQVEQGRVQKWDLLVARMKSEGIKWPQLIDEALDHLFYLLEKYKA